MKVPERSRGREVCVREFVRGQTSHLSAAFLVCRGGIVGRQSHSLLQGGFVSSNQEDCMQLSACRFCQFEERRIEVRVFRERKHASMTMRF